MAMSNKLFITGSLAGLALVVGLLVTLIVLMVSRPIFAETPVPTPSGSTAQAIPTHEQMHQMMDAMHGEGTNQRMHEAMGPDAEKMMDQCAAMMNMMDGMSGMSSLQGMMGAEGTRGMMGQ